MDSSDEEVDRAEESQGGGRVVRKWTDRWGTTAAKTAGEGGGGSEQQHVLVKSVGCAPYSSSTQDM